MLLFALYRCSAEYVSLISTTRADHRTPLVFFVLPRAYWSVQGWYGLAVILYRYAFLFIRSTGVGWGDTALSGFRIQWG